MSSKREFSVRLYGVGPDRVFMKVPAASPDEAAETTVAWLDQQPWQQLDTGAGVVWIRSAFVSRIEVF